MAWEAVVLKRFDISHLFLSFEKIWPFSTPPLSFFKQIFNLKKIEPTVKNPVA